MTAARAHKSLLSVVQSTVAKATLALAALTMTGCPNGDVGAPCNHGGASPPSAFLVTFPALSCNDLLCIYAEAREAPDEIECNSDAECNDNPADKIFACSENNRCQLSNTYLLERSMCSKKCSSDDDCNNTGAFNKPAVDDDETTCKNGFECKVLQTVGDFCCESTCVCVDDLPDLSDIATKCAPGMKEQTCD